jgi:2-polyprenyl-3-methyl-5-hydroxy-6-metoxy-1,4-benzoquinol methylase
LFDQEDCTVTEDRLDEGARLEMHSGGYVNVMENLPVHRLSRLLPMMHLRPTDILVDLACGPGVLSHLVHDQIAQYQGVDFSPEFVASATASVRRMGISNATFHCEDVVSYCSRLPESADVITAFDFSEHIYDEDFLRIFGAAYAMLKEGGKLYLYTPNLEFIYERMKDRGLARQFPQHIAVRDEKAHWILLMACGFKAENIKCTFPSHFNVFRYLHPLTRLPWLGRHFRAKLFFTCIK